jgi:hemerythrin-like metal-binding protein
VRESRLIEWKDRYSVGNDGIDDDHKKIIEIINNLHSNLKNFSEQDVIKDIIARLFEYTQYHFAREESILEKANYPDLEKHRAVHRSLTEKTQELTDQLMHNSQGVPLRTMSFLKDWWIDHIIVMDLKYKKYIEGHKIVHSESC